MVIFAVATFIARLPMVLPRHLICPAKKKGHLMLSQKKYLQLYRPKIRSVGIRQRKGVIAAERWWGKGNGEGGFCLYPQGRGGLGQKQLLALDV
ncbi:MAG: hypothetical protein EOO05_20730 [Chitinophagaceae bacterium]|nr:MAG: hypothetical protein EOO05_20730 [Chitinophagaceae bacterium]